MLPDTKPRARNATRARCLRCGLLAKLSATGLRKRFKINAYEWSVRCHALKRGAQLKSPFDCPDMKAATSGGRRS